MKICGLRQSILEKNGIPVPIIGKQVLRNGKTGLPLDQPVTVGVMTMSSSPLVETKYMPVPPVRTAWRPSSRGGKRILVVALR
jgi:hypothetical protein